MKMFHVKPGDLLLNWDLENYTQVFTSENDKDKTYIVKNQT